MVLFHRYFVAGDTPVFLPLLVSKITVVMGFASQGVFKKGCTNGAFATPRCKAIVQLIVAHCLVKFIRAFFVLPRVLYSHLCLGPMCTLNS